MSSFTIRAVGDVGAKRADLASMFRGVADRLRASPVVFGQLETVVSDRGAIVPNARLAMRAPAALAPVLREAGFTCMSFAGNHCLDWGYDAFHDTLAAMADADVRLAGAGADLTAAIAPAFQQIGDTRIALIAANAILPEGYAADARKPGCAPLRGHTLYEQIEHDQPGTPARTHSFADPRDLARLIAAVESARRAADIVLVSLHWGIHMVKGSVADYQRDAGHAVIEAGADAILGHHPHIMKGIEIHRGKPIFYSLGNFAIEQPHVWDPAIVETESFRHFVSLNPAWSMDSAYMLPEETRITGIANLLIEDRRLAGIRFEPGWVEDDSAPRMLAADEPLFGRVADYLREVTVAEGFATRIFVEGDSLVIAACSDRPSS